MGRKPIGKRAMTSAERQRRFLAKLSRNLTDRQVMELADREIERLQAENADLKTRIAELERRGVGPQLMRSHRR
jgi:hypothetical protein